MEYIGLLNVSVGNAEIARLAFEKGYDVYAVTTGFCIFDRYQCDDNGNLAPYNTNKPGERSRIQCAPRNVMPISRIIEDDDGNKKLYYVKHYPDEDDTFNFPDQYIDTCSNQQNLMIYIAINSKDSALPEKGLDRIVDALVKYGLSYSIIEFYAHNNCSATLSTMYFMTDSTTDMVIAAFISADACKLTNPTPFGDPNYVTPYPAYIIDVVLRKFNIKDDPSVLQMLSRFYGNINPDHTSED